MKAEVEAKKLDELKAAEPALGKEIALKKSWERVRHRRRIAWLSVISM